MKKKKSIPNEALKASQDGTLDRALDMYSENLSGQQETKGLPHVPQPHSSIW